jgi:hypothetical protein
MSAFGGKADIRHLTASCPLLTQSGHSAISRLEHNFGRPVQQRAAAITQVDGHRTLH